MSRGLVTYLELSLLSSWLVASGAGVGRLGTNWTILAIPCPIITAPAIVSPEI